MSEFLGSFHAHKLWSLAILFVTPVLVVVAVRFGGLTLERMRHWIRILVVILLGLWIVLRALDDPRVDFVSAFMISFLATVEWIAWFERRRAVKRNAA
jgi:Sec-independent protein secretion pathway component TatC